MMVDTKTRRQNSLPSDDDALSSRLQLMLYHRFLNSLLDSSFDFPGFWARNELDSQKSFSEIFLSQVYPILDGIAAPQLSCLDDVTQLWLDMVPKLDISGVDATLHLIYRLRPTTFQTSKPKVREVAVAEQHRAALEANLQEIAEVDGLAKVLAESVNTAVASGRQMTDEDAEMLLAIQQSIQQSFLDAKDCKSLQPFFSAVGSLDSYISSPIFARHISGSTLARSCTGK